MELFPHPLGELALEMPPGRKAGPTRLIVRFGDLEVAKGMQVPHTLVARPPFCSIDPQEVTPGRTFALFWVASAKAEAPMSELIWASVNLTVTRKGLIGGDTIAEYVRPSSTLDRLEVFYLYEQPATPVNLDAMPNKQEISMEQRGGFDPAVFATRHEMRLVSTLSFLSIIMTPERLGEPAADQMAPMGTLYPDNIPTRGAPNYTPQWRSRPGRMLSQSIQPEPP